MAIGGSSARTENLPLKPPVDSPAVVLYMPKIGSPGCVI